MAKKPVRPPFDPRPEGGVGASDADNGGGAGAGIPDAETALRTDAVNRGDVKADRKRLFPGRDTDDSAERPSDETE